MMLGKWLIRELKNGVSLMAGIIVAAFILPFAILAMFFAWIVYPKTERGAVELAENLKGILAGQDSDGHWDDLESVSIKEPQLEAIRKEALTVPMPLDDAGRAKLTELLVRTETLSGAAPQSQ